MMDSHRDEIAKLESLYASNPEGRVFTHLAEACRKAGQLERAREILEDGLRRHPDYASAHVVLGRVLIDIGDVQGAANEFRRVLELDRHNLVALRSLGDLARAGDRHEEALYYYGELAVLDPTDGGIQEEIRRLRAQLAESLAAAPAQPEAPAETPGAAGEPAAAAAEEPAAATTPEPSVEPVAADVAEEPAVTAEPIEADTYFEPAGTTEGGEDRPSGWSTWESAAPSRDRAGLAEEDAAAASGTEMGGFVDTGADAGPYFAGASAAEASASGSEGGDLSISDVSLTGPEPEAGEPAGAGGQQAPAWGTPGGWPTPPASPEAERRAELGDSGEWIPAERWEWMAASADPNAEPAADTAEGEAESVAEADEVETPAWLAEDPGWKPPSGAGYEPEPSPAEPFESEPVVELTAEFEAMDASVEAAPPEPEPLEPALGDYSLADDDDDEGDLVITETLAEIYAQQGLYDRAAAVYRRLVKQRPGDERLQARLRELENTPSWGGSPAESAATESAAGGEAWLERVESAWTGAEGAVGAQESPWAWPSESQPEDTGARVGDYFRSLLTWRPGASQVPNPGLPETAAPAAEVQAGTVDADSASAFDEWFGRENVPGTESGGESARSAGSEADEDLEMFRSWLKSLKK